MLTMLTDQLGCSPVFLFLKVTRKSAQKGTFEDDFPFNTGGSHVNIVPWMFVLPNFFVWPRAMVPMVLYPWIIQKSGHLGEISNFMRLWLHNLHTSQTFCFSGSVTFLKFQKKRTCVKTFWNLPGCVTIKWVVSKFDVYFSRLCFQRRFFFWEAMHSSKFWFMNQPDVRPKRMFWVLGFWVG